MEKVKNDFKYSLIDRLRMGEIIPCSDCKKDFYITDDFEIETSDFFYCKSCGNYVIAD